MRRACARQASSFPAQWSSQNFGSGAPKSGPAADEAVAAVLLQVGVAGGRHERPEDPQLLDHRLRRLEELVEAGSRVLQRDDRVDLGQAQDEVGLHVDGGAVHPVVDHERGVGRSRELLVVGDDLVVERLHVGRRGRLDAVGARRDRVPRKRGRLPGRVGGAADHDGHPPPDSLDRVLGDLHALVGRLGEPLSRRAVDQDAVQALVDVPLEQLAVALRVVALVGGERGWTRGPVTAPGYVVSIHAGPFRSGAYSSGSGSPPAMLAASIRATNGPRVKPVGARHMK